MARVAVDVSLPHLDRPFDYRVPQRLSETAIPGVRVRVRFAGALHDGYVLERTAESEVARLQPLERVISPIPVATPEVLQLARSVADHCAGTLADVLRLAVPPRHATSERQPPVGPAALLDPPPAGVWTDYDGGAGYLSALVADGPAPRASWQALSGHGMAGLATAAATVAAAGRGVLIVLPDQRDVDLCGSALAEVMAPGAWTSLTHSLGPAERYRRFLAVLRGDHRCVIGTRAAGFAPVSDLGLIAVWDDGDDALSEPRSPYPHARDVAAIRAHQGGCALLLAGHAVSTDTARLLETGWLRPIRAARSTVRAQTARVRVVGDETASDPHARAARVPEAAWRGIRKGLASGPVLVQTPRAGYWPGLACRGCRSAARCTTCSGPLVAGSGHSIPSCRWCARPAGAWACPSCGDTRWRATVAGATRTAEELGRAFAGVRVRTSTAERALAHVPDDPVLVVSTPGVEPVAAGGYAAAVFLDADLVLSRAALRVDEEALRRWLNAAALVRPSGEVLVVGDSAWAPVQALVRWDPEGFANRELASRAELGLPPARRAAVLTGAPDVLARACADLPGSARVLGPVADGEGRDRSIVTVQWSESAQLARHLHDAQAVATARKEGPLSVRLDPDDLA